MRTRLGRAVMALLLCTAAPVLAQTPSVGPVGLTATSTNCAPTSCVQLASRGVGATGVQITGTFVGTVVVEGTTDGSTFVTLPMNPSDGTAAVTSATAPGAWLVNASAYVTIRARVSAYTSGTINVTILGTPLSARSGGTFNGGTITTAETINIAGIAAVSTPGLTLTNTTDATAGVQLQYSPSLTLSSSGWDTVEVGPDREDWKIEAIPVAGGPPTNGTLVFSRSMDGAAYVSQMTMGAASGAGRVDFPGDLKVTGNTQILQQFLNGNTTKIIGTVASNVVATTFCTSPTVPNFNGTFAFTINVGTGCATSTGTITLPAASNGWTVFCNNETAPASNVPSQTGGTTTTATLTNYARTTGVASNWTDGNVLRCLAMGY